MKKVYNRKLHELAESSALKSVGTMLFICDSELYVCMRSVGAERQVVSVTVGYDLKPCLEPAVVSELTIKKRSLRGWLTLGDSLVSTLFIHGEAGGEEYIAAICEVGRLYGGEPALSALAELGFDRFYSRIGEQINELLCRKENKPDRLIRSRRSLIRARRLLELNERARERGGARDSEPIPMSRMLETVIGECRRILPDLRLELSRGPGEVYFRQCGREELTGFILSLLFNELAVSDNSAVSVTLEPSVRGRSMLRFVTETRKLPADVRSADELAGRLCGDMSSPFALDLIAGIELAGIFNWEMGCVCEGGVLELWARLPVSESCGPLLVLRAPDEERLRSEIGSLAELLMP